MSKSKNFKQRWLPLALVPLFSVSVLAGCGSDDDDGGGETDEVVIDPDMVTGDMDGMDGTDGTDGSDTDTDTDTTGDMTGTVLTAADQVGPLDIPLSDAGTAALDWDGSNLTGQISIEGLPDGVGPARAALRTGIAAAGNGAELVQFNGDGNPSYFLPTPLAADQAATVAQNIASGNLFIQVDLSDGTSRDGIILLPGINPEFAELTAGNAVPAGTEFSNGAGFININSVTGDFSAVVNINLNASDVDADGNPETVSMVHIHTGAAGEEGPVIVTLEDAGNGLTWTAQDTFSAENLALVLAGDTYFNVHRTDGTNFIRGQIPQ